MFNNMMPESKNDNGCVIFSNNKYKIMWDLFVSVLLLFVCIVVPYRITFVTDENPDVELAFNLFDAIFAIDMILSFFTTIPDDENMCEITDRKTIAVDYLTSWFPIYFVSILPISTIMEAISPPKDGESSSSSSNLLLRTAKLGKIYKFIRLFRLVKVFKILKNKDKLASQFSKQLEINNGTERLTFVTIILVFLLHLSSCFWVLLN